MVFFLTIFCGEQRVITPEHLEATATEIRRKAVRESETSAHI